MIIEEAISIQAPLNHVWQVFSCMDQWDRWNTVCQQCCYLEGDEMARGTCFSFVIRPFNLPVKITPEILSCEPGKHVVWQGRRLGVHAVHGFYFKESDGYTELKSVERFSGPLMWLSRLVFVPGRLHRLTRRLLQAIRTEAEQRYRAENVRQPDV